MTNGRCCDLQAAASWPNSAEVRLRKPCKHKECSEEETEGSRKKANTRNGEAYRELNFFITTSVRGEHISLTSDLFAKPKCKSGKRSKPNNSINNDGDDNNTDTARNFPCG